MRVAGPSATGASGRSTVDIMDHSADHSSARRSGVSLVSRSSPPAERDARSVSGAGRRAISGSAIVRKLSMRSAITSSARRCCSIILAATMSIPRTFESLLSRSIAVNGSRKSRWTPASKERLARLAVSDRSRARRKATLSPSTLARWSCRPSLVRGFPHGAVRDFSPAAFSAEAGALKCSAAMATSTPSIDHGTVSPVRVSQGFRGIRVSCAIGQSVLRALTDRPVTTSRQGP